MKKISGSPRAAPRNDVGVGQRPCHPDSADLPLQLDAGRLLHLGAHGLAQRLDVVAGGRAGVDEKVCSASATPPRADADTAHPGGVDQLPGAVARRVLEGASRRSSRGSAARSRGGPAPRPCARGSRRAPRCGRERSRPVKITDGSTPIAAKTNSCRRWRTPPCRRRGWTPARLHQHVLGLAAVGAGVHAQRAADRAGDAEVEFKPCDVGGGPRLPPRASRSAAVPARTVSPAASIAPKPRAATGGSPRRRRRRRARSGWSRRRSDRPGRPPQPRQEKASRPRPPVNSNLRRAADAKPGQRRQRLVGEQPAAQLGHGGAQVGRDVGEGHERPLSTSPPQAGG